MSAEHLPGATGAHPHRDSVELPGYAPQHPAFAGHFPGHPIVPGVLLLDAVLHQLGATQETRCRISMVKFMSVVQAGENLRLQHALMQGSVRFDLHAGTRKVASGSLQGLLGNTAQQQTAP